MATHYPGPGAPQRPVHGPTKHHEDASSVNSEWSSYCGRYSKWASLLGSDRAAPYACMHACTPLGVLREVSASPG